MASNPFLALLFSVFASRWVLIACQAPALFLFGDALVDAGNNNVLPTQVKADFAPYGVANNNTPTGRFCDGKLIPDFVASCIGLPSPPPFLRATNFTKGVNFASAASGILRWPGTGALPSLSDQVNQFQRVHNTLVSSMGVKEAAALLQKSIFYINTGNSDVNRFLHLFKSPLPLMMRNTLLHLLAEQIRRLHLLGARKFVIVNLLEVGCAPIHQQAGRCSAAGMRSGASYNAGLGFLVNRLRQKYRNAVFLAADIASILMEVKLSPSIFGFENTMSACCPLNGTARPCTRGSPVCDDPSAYMFWDVNYPTEAFNSLVAEEWCYSNSPHISPYNISRLASL